MSRPNKSIEPSMEEILASIRKIISEEPIGTRPGPTDGQPPAGDLGRIEPGAEPSLTSPAVSSAAQRPQAADSVGIDEMLELAQDVPRRDQSSSARHLSGGTGSQERDAASPSHVEVKPLASAGRAALTSTQAQGTPRVAKAVFPTLTREGGTNDAVIEVTTSPVSQSPADATKEPMPAPQVDAALSEARAKIERHLGRPSSPPIADRPLVPGLKSVRDAEFLGTKPEPAGRSPAGSLMARVAAAGGQGEPGGSNASAVPESDASTRPAVAVAPLTSVHESTQTASARLDASKAGAPDPRPLDVAAKPSAAGNPNSNPMQGEAKPLQDAATPGGKAAAVPVDRTRAFEEAVAEMLRPMLREWLEANLPRLVQQALREEMSRSQLPGKANPTV